MDPCAEWCERLGFEVDPTRWRTTSWFHHLRQLLELLERTIPPGTPFMLIDDGLSGMTPTPTRRVQPFPERNGIWWGAPADDAAAIAELERQRAAGARYLAVVWIAGWWLDYYSGFAAYLRERYSVALEHEIVTVFGL